MGDDTCHDHKERQEVVPIVVYQFCEVADNQEQCSQNNHDDSCILFHNSIYVICYIYVIQLQNNTFSVRWRNFFVKKCRTSPKIGRDGRCLSVFLRLALIATLLLGSLVRVLLFRESKFLFLAAIHKHHT